ncbi:MAG: VacJ family lipoprotein [Myxococcales bacterium]|jgi:phospholipid-binding lipoprotein MlaA|nr:MAG: VacJ family lipoprotein [Myxococcales bacterium]
MRRGVTSVSALLLVAWVALAPLAPALAEDLAPDPVADLSGTPAGPGPSDPLEPMNRKIFAFNDFLSRNALEPLGRGWAWLVPEVIRDSIGRAYANLRTPVVMVNDLLQGKPRAAGVDLARFVMNSSVGLGGLMDPALACGLEPNHEDFGQTFGVWGIPPGPYLVIPILGPSSPRDAAGRAADTAAFAASYFIPFWLSAASGALDTANTFSFVAEDIASERAASFDWYAAVRNAHVSHRENLVRDRTESEEQAAEEDDLYLLDDEMEE